MANDKAAPAAVSGEPGGPDVELAAQWALWGKGTDDRAYQVLASSTGDLTAADFTEVVERYASGVADHLPQYTVFWVPGSDGTPVFAGVAIHERASYAPQDDRGHFDASGREIVYSRLFCVRYADLARHAVTFTELISAAEQQLLSRDQSAPVMLRITKERAPGPPWPAPAADAAPELTEVVAALLLTTRPVCVIGADGVPASERLAFINQVLSLLPYGLRATLSAATWASPTAQNLKLRLFFASTPRDGSDQTYHVRWGRQSQDAQQVRDGEDAGRYLAWLRGTGAQARAILSEQTAPLRFNPADIRTMVEALPRDLRVPNVLQDLAESLREGDVGAATAEIKRLKRYQVDPVRPADRERYRSQILKEGLLGNHWKLHSRTSAAVNRMLLQLAFEFPLSYGSYCKLEDAIGGQPRGMLRSVLLDLTFANYIPWLLTAKAEPGSSDKELMATLEEQGNTAVAPLDEFQRRLADIRPAHRAIVYDFAVLYLRTHTEDAKAELAKRGYLAEALMATFPDDPEAQRIRVESTLLFVHGGSLSRGQIRDLFSEPCVRPTAAFEAAVGRLASSPKAGRLIAEQAAVARGRNAGDGDMARSDHAEPRSDHGSRLGYLLIRLIRRLAGSSRDPVGKRSKDPARS